MDKPYAELEIGLHRIQAESYQVELRFINPGSDAEKTPVHETCPLDLEVLLPLQQDPQAYGEALSAQVFHAPKALEFYKELKATVESAGSSLRVRLLVGPTAPDLHALRWELLTDPDTKAPFTRSEKVLFSRFMASRDWRPVRLRPKADLRALVAVAAPANIDKYKLAAIDIDGEIDRASNSLAGTEVVVAGKDQPLTLTYLDQCLRKGFDILYLVCHGVFSPDDREPILFLQDDARQVERVSGNDLAERIGEMVQPPRLVVLASC